MTDITQSYSSITNKYCYKLVQGFRVTCNNTTEVIRKISTNNDLFKTYCLVSFREKEKETAIINHHWKEILFATSFSVT